MVYVVDVLKIYDEFFFFLLVLFLIFEMLFLLKLLNVFDFKSVYYKSNKCVLFFYDMINFVGDLV